MRLKLLTLALFCLGATCARAEGNVGLPAREKMLRDNLWYQSGNAAGEALRPLGQLSDLNFSWTGTSGEWHAATDAGKSNVFSLSTRGTASVGRFKIRGDFAFRDIFERDCRFNSLLYEVPEDLPYYFIDKWRSRWDKQEYDMGAALAFPFAQNRLAAGMDLRYKTTVGAKQKDPRVETRVLNLTASPSLVWHPQGAHMFGLSGVFHYGHEYARPENNSPANQTVFLCYGLGEGIMGTVGGNTGLNEFFYKTLRYGASLQWGWNGAADLLVEAGLSRQTTDAEEQISLPKSRGLTRQARMYLSAQALWGLNRSNRAALSVSRRATDGIEKVQHRDDTPGHQRWVTDAENKMSTYGRLSALLSYDHQWDADEKTGYRWNAGGSVDWQSEDDRYPTAPASFKWSTLALQGFGARQFRWGRSSLLVRLHAAYGLSLSGSYVYEGGAKEALQRPWQAELDFRKANYIRTGGRLGYVFHARKVGWNLNLDGDYAFVPGTQGQNRLVTCLSFGILF